MPWAREVLVCTSRSTDLEASGAEVEGIDKETFRENCLSLM